MVLHVLKAHFWVRLVRTPASPMIKQPGAFQQEEIRRSDCRGIRKEEVRKTQMADGGHAIGRS